MINILDECTTLWGEPEQVHVLNVRNYTRNETEHNPTLPHIMYNKNCSDLTGISHCHNKIVTGV